METQTHTHSHILTCHGIRSEAPTYTASMFSMQESHFSSTHQKPKLVQKHFFHLTSACKNYKFNRSLTHFLGKTHPKTNLPSELLIIFNSHSHAEAHTHTQNIFAFYVQKPARSAFGKFGHCNVIDNNMWSVSGIERLKRGYTNNQNIHKYDCWRDVRLYRYYLYLKHWNMQYSHFTWYSKRTVYSRTMHSFMWNFALVQKKKQPSMCIRCTHPHKLFN